MSRAPHGARGLKPRSAPKKLVERSRAPHGARGLKPEPLHKEQLEFGRAPHGARGLKLTIRLYAAAIGMSRPARGAWIETSKRMASARPVSVAPRTGRVD